MCNVFRRIDGSHHSQVRLANPELLKSGLYHSSHSQPIYLRPLNRTSTISYPLQYLVHPLSTIYARLRMWVLSLPREPMPVDRIHLAYRARPRAMFACWSSTQRPNLLEKSYILCIRARKLRRDIGDEEVLVRFLDEFFRLWDLVLKDGLRRLCY